MNPEMENQISHKVDSEKMEMSSKVMHICEDQNENTMEVTQTVGSPYTPDHCAARGLVVRGTQNVDVHGRFTASKIDH